MNHTEELIKATETMRQWLTQNALPEIKTLFVQILLLTELCEADALGYTDNPIYAEIKQAYEALKH